jgi:hypothetical protein
VAIAGDVISDGLRIAAKRDLGRVFDRAIGAARTAGPEVLEATARRPFELLEVDHGTLSRFIDRFRGSILWTDEGNCFNRAMAGAHMLDEMVGLGAAPTSDAFTAAIAVNRHFNAAGYDAGFHAAVAVRPRWSPDVLVVDPLPGNRTLQPLRRWSHDPEPMLLRPFAGTGLWDGVGYRSTWVGDQYFAGARELLHQTWDAAEQYGVTVRGLGPRPS